ncbi:GNAT family N-acetyltransferase [Saccharospirillum sp. HFRX-1]|uniref:GNAT family N-acetyltransferase n=1 Tax=unclassified Saccharospirillum TaxID=2633430 RepID=UPI00371D65E3
MSDLIVSLQQLPAPPALPEGYQIQPAQAWDRELIVDWVRREFGAGWASEVANGLSGHPSRVLIARRGAQLLGFACFDVTFPGFFGPTGVNEAARGLGLGKALLVEALHRLKQRGYVYGFIGDAGPVDFYRKAVGAVLVPEPLAGAYTDPLEPH